MCCFDMVGTSNCRHMTTWWHDDSRKPDESDKRQRPRTGAAAKGRRHVAGAARDPAWHFRQATWQVRARQTSGPIGRYEAAMKILRERVGGGFVRESGELSMVPPEMICGFPSTDCLNNALRSWRGFRLGCIAPLSNTPHPTSLSLRSARPPSPHKGRRWGRGKRRSYCTNA